MTTTSHVIATLTNVKLWPDTLRDRKVLTSNPAVYALILDERFSRLLGTTQILYIGQTGRLGGESDRSRLYGYRYPSGNHGRLIRTKADRLIALGYEITFRWKVVESEEESKRLEADLLQMHLSEHLEFPPFNGKS
jgi:hypothetical protein